jgi:hypothetical protein
MLASAIAAHTTPVFTASISAQAAGMDADASAAHTTPTYTAAISCSMAAMIGSAVYVPRVVPDGAWHVTAVLVLTHNISAPLVKRADTSTTLLAGGSVAVGVYSRGEVTMPMPLGASVALRV